MPTPLLELDWAAYADEIGHRVETVRRFRKVSQTELAAATGISRTQIQNIERSRSSPKKSDAQVETVPPARESKRKVRSNSSKKTARDPAKKRTTGNATIQTLFVIAQALGVSPRILIPDGIPTGDYRTRLDETWSRIEFDINSEIANHPMPETTRASDLVSPLIDPKVWIAEYDPSANLPVPKFPIAELKSLELTDADRAAIHAASPEIVLEPPKSKVKPPPPGPNAPTATGSLLRTPTIKKPRMIRHDATD